MLILNKNILTIGGNRLECVHLTPPTPPGPIPLPPNTVRVRTNDSNVPAIASYSGATYETATLVSGTTDVYDVYKSGSSFNKLIYYSRNVVEIIGVNITGITDVSYMFGGTSITTVPLFDTSEVTNMMGMFSDCYSLTSIPLYNTSKVSNINTAFYHCYKVESGALALYQQASSQAIPPSKHSRTFEGCGRDTTTGSAEVAQIPSDWGGTGA